MKGVHGKSATWGEGVYENEYALQDGVWKISKLHYYLTFRVDYDKGFPKDPLPIDKVSETLPPDSPPTEVYGAFPEVYVPPYHYQNLVTHAQARPAMGDIPEDVASLARKISLLNDEIDVQNLQRSYGYYVDKAMWDEVSDLFADNATLEIGGRGVFVGKKRINQYMHFLGQQGPKKGAVFDHSQWQPVTHVADDGNTAKQRLRAFIMAGGLGDGTDAGRRRVRRGDVRKRVREGERRVEDFEALRVLQHVHAVRQGMGEGGDAEHASGEASAAGSPAHRGV